jgi:hypothetical protein
MMTRLTLENPLICPYVNHDVVNLHVPAFVKDGNPATGVAGVYSLGDQHSVLPQIQGWPIGSDSHVVSSIRFGICPLICSNVRPNVINTQ